MRAAVFLDRDGTINEEVNYLDHAENLRLIQGAGQAIHLLNEAALPAILVTNQSAIGRGYFSKARLNEVHRELARQLAGYDAHLDAIYYCPTAQIRAAPVVNRSRACWNELPRSMAWIWAVASSSATRPATWRLGAGRAVAPSWC